MNRIDLTGQKFGCLEVLCYSHSNKKYDSFWVCKCDCGNRVVARGADIKNGHTTSCGCIQRKNASIKNSSHRMTDTRLYRIWHSMKSRCTNAKQNRYKDYGGRGICVCDEWINDFGSFYEWAITNGYSDELTIDRIDVNGNYCPENCRWITQKEQANNTRKNRLITFSGKTQTMQQWADELGIDSKTIHNRIECLHWDVEKALTVPVKKYARGEV